MFFKRRAVNFMKHQGATNRVDVVDYPLRLIKKVGPIASGAKKKRRKRRKRRIKNTKYDKLLFT